jgi:2,4-dienoyl-CoA reductase-like NADH-dependent reductase (Old Yellow Enzyme family)
MRRKTHMEKVIETGNADFISLARPLIREPSLVNKFKEGKVEAASCTSCNKCIGAVMNQLPTACYCNGLP